MVLISPETRFHLAEIETQKLRSNERTKVKGILNGELIFIKQFQKVLRNRESK